jgi:glycosyltransferase
LFFSIITATFNSSKTITKNIKSVSDQSYKDFEQIFIDGGSIDDTKKIIINNCKNTNYNFYDLPVKGIYNAFNVGLKLAKGKYIIYLNSDDYFFNKEILYKVYKCIINNKYPDLLYGDINYVNSNEKIIRKWKSNEYHKYKINFGWCPPHTGTFISSKLAKKYRFNSSFSVSADYDFLIKIFSNKDIKIHYLKSTITNMLIGGASNKLKNFFIVFAQDYQISKRYLKFPMINVISKKLSKIIQFF